MTDAIRREARHIEFPDAAWMAFDRYTRYAALVRAARAATDGKEARVLDVGDSAGYVASFEPRFGLVCLDVAATPEPLPGTTRVVGDGSKLPFPDRSFDVVLSADTLEHLPEERRPEFLAEMARVTRNVVVLAAPFDTPGVAGAEEAVRRFVLLATGEHQQQLEEHRDCGLPSLHVTSSVLGSLGMEVKTAGAGNLHDWLAMMLLKHQLSSRPALTPLEAGYDILYNFMFASRERIAPFYRHLVVATRNGAPLIGDAPVPADGMPADISALLATIGVTSVAEVSRQDSEPRLEDIRHRSHEIVGLLAETRQTAAAFGPQLAAFEASVIARLEELDARAATQEKVMTETVEDVRRVAEEVGRRLHVLSDELRFTRSSVDRLTGLIRHPVRSVAAKLRRR